MRGICESQLLSWKPYERREADPASVGEPFPHFEALSSDQVLEVSPRAR